VENNCYTVKMALELSKRAYDMCVGKDASALQSLLDAHPGIDLYLFELEGEYNIMGGAAAHESSECLQVLLDFKADVNSRDRATGSTPLHAAIQYGRVGCMRLLLENNADVTIADARYGRTAIIMAAVKGRPKCLKLMIDAKADVDHQIAKGFTCLHLACQEGYVECVRLLIDSNAEVHLQTENGDTGLTLAAFMGHLECLKLMIEAKADINRQASDGQNALSLAVTFGHLSSLYALLDHPSDVLASDHVKAVALIQAFEEPDVGFPAKNQTAAFTLLACGADIKKAIKDRDIPKDRIQSATSRYRNVLGFIDRWHGVAVIALSDSVEVDTRVGRGDYGLFTRSRWSECCNI
jgi:ankyrin repeat protein